MTIFFKMRFSLLYGMGLTLVCVTFGSRKALTVNFFPFS